MRRGLLLGIVAALAASAALATAAAGRGGIGDARDFRAFDVYLGGHRVIGLRLAEVSVFSGDRPRWAEVVGFYGDCETRPGGGGGCRYELQVGNTSMCRTYPAIYYSPPRLQTVNGAQAGWIRTAHIYDVYTGRTAVSIFGVSRKEAHRIAKELRDLRPSQRSDELPAPNERLLRGKGRCQHGPGVPPPPPPPG